MCFTHAFEGAKLPCQLPATPPGSVTTHRRVAADNRCTVAHTQHNTTTIPTQSGFPFSSTKFDVLKGHQPHRPGGGGGACLEWVLVRDARYGGAATTTQQVQFVWLCSNTHTCSGVDAICGAIHFIEAPAPLPHLKQAQLLRGFNPQQHTQPAAPKPSRGLFLCRVLQGELAPQPQEAGFSC